MAATEGLIKKLIDMKRLLVTLILAIMSTAIVYSQDVDLTKLSSDKREKMLFEIAVAAMKKYAPSYYSESIKPRLGHQGPVSSKTDKYYGKMVYVIRFPYDLNKVIVENREGENVYGGDVVILGETGKVISIYPTGWWAPLEIPEESATRGSNTPHPVAEPTKVPANPFKNW
jgi:hypothetical protein